MVRHFWIIFCLMFIITESLMGSESLFYKANELAKNAQYDEAINQYNQLLQTDIHNGYLYYNLGYCFYRKGEIGKAILNFKRALYYQPRNADALANLNNVRKKVEDQLSYTEPPTIWQYIFFWLNWFSPKELLWVGSLIVSMLLIFLLLRKVFVRNREYFAIPVALSLIVTTFYLVGLLLYYGPLAKPIEGVVINPEVSVQSGLGVDSVTLFSLHEGAEFIVKDRLNGGVRIELRNKDGKGWVRKSFVEIVAP